MQENNEMVKILQTGGLVTSDTTPFAPMASGKSVPKSPREPESTLKLNSKDLYFTTQYP
jgi:hypothetical protein